MNHDFELQQLDHFAHLLNDIGTIRINAKQLWHAFAIAFPHRSLGSEERTIFLAALTALEERGVLSLPSKKGKRWDHSMYPAIPISIDLIKDKSATPAPDWHHFPWHPLLHWISDLKILSPEQFKFLQRVHQGFVNKEFSEPAPLKYRSLQLTGNEKRLETLTQTSLFESGRLTLDMLGCLPEILPLAWESIDDGARMIIFENAGPFTVARRVLSEMRNPPYALIGYGGGRSILASIGHLKTINRNIQKIDYVGDIDIAGLDIALAAHAKTLSLGLPELQPAKYLHKAMLEAADALGFPNGWPDSNKSLTKQITELVNFIAPEYRSEVMEVLKHGNRIPEEVLGPVQMRLALEWS